MIRPCCVKGDICPSTVATPQICSTSAYRQHNSEVGDHIERVSRPGVAFQNWLSAPVASYLAAGFLVRFRIRLPLLQHVSSRLPKLAFSSGCLKILLPLEGAVLQQPQPSSTPKVES